MAKMDPKTTEILTSIGRGIAEEMIEAAVKSSENVDQMGNQIFALRRTALSILAHEAFNIQEQLGHSFIDYQASLLRDLSVEFQMLVADDEGTLELLKTKDHR